MAFLIPHEPLTPLHRMALDVDPAVRVVRAGDLAAYREAEQAVEVARAQASAIVQNAHAAYEAERMRGFAEGVEQAQREGAQHMIEQLARTHEYFGRVSTRLVDLVMQATRRIVEGYTDRERVAHGVRNALSVVRNQKQITVRVHPQHVENLRTRTDELLVGYPGVNLLDVIGDKRLGPDTCVLESEIGVVEASTEGQLAALEAAFSKVMSNGLDQPIALDATLF